MEKTTVENTKISENLILTNRKSLKLEGIVEINNSSESQLSIKMKDTNLIIFGQNLNITRLDVELGILEVEGLIDCIKYGKSIGFIKRIFK